jgi:hypothetical protein
MDSDTNKVISKIFKTFGLDKDILETFVVGYKYIYA